MTISTTKQLRLRRGTTSEHGNFIGAPGEITVDTDLNTIRVHDGVTPAGHLVRGTGTAIVSWADVINKPTIPTDISQLTDNDSLLGADRLVNGPHQLVLSVSGAGPYVTFPTDDGVHIGIQGGEIAAIGDEIMLTSAESAVRLSANAAGNRKDWLFGIDGGITFPPLEVNLHNGGVQIGQVLQFGESGRQAIITGPTPPNNANAERLIIQGQRATGTGEGGDVYLWAGDSQINGGDIKIYAGDADGVTAGYGGYVNIDGGYGLTQGGHVLITGGSSNTISGNLTLRAGQGGDHGSVYVSTYGHQWTFDANGVLTLPASGDIKDSNGNSVLSDSFSGSYLDLTNTPTIPADINQLTDNDSLLGAVTTDRLVNGEKEVTLQSNGYIRLVNGAQLYDYGSGTGNGYGITDAASQTYIGYDPSDTLGALHLDSYSGGNIRIRTTTLPNTYKDWLFSNDGVLSIPLGGDIKQNGVSVLSSFSGSYTDLTDLPTNLATESYVGVAVANLVNSSPATLDTLNELATALGNDVNFSTTVATALGNRLRVDINTQNLDATQQNNAVTNLGLATVATSGSYDDLSDIPTFFDGDYNSLTNKPTLLTGPAGNDGAQGPQGEPGATGADGAPGQGVPTGGTVGQVLAKIDSTDYNTEWVNQTSGGPTNEITNTDGISTWSVSVGTDGVVTMNTVRGGIEFGAMPEVGGPNHLHIMRPSGQNGSTDLFFGDDYNYVKLPGLYGQGTQGVEIGSSFDTDPPKVWRFGTDGTLTLPNGLLGDVYGGPLLSSNADKPVTIWTDNGINGWEFGADGILRIQTYGEIAVEHDLGVRIGSFSTTTAPNSQIKIGGADHAFEIFGGPPGYSWQFDTNGILTLPAGGKIAEGGGITGAIKLTPAGGANEYQALMIYPTAAGDGDHIHLTAGGGTTDLYLGNDSQYVKIQHGGNVVIQSVDGASTNQWLFGTDGDLTAPRNIILNNPVTTVTETETGTIADSGNGSGGEFTFRILKSANPQLITPFADPNFALKWTGGDAGSLAAAAQAPNGHGVSSLVSDDGTYWNFNSWYGLGGTRPTNGTVFSVDYGVVVSDTMISTTDTNLVIEADTKQYKFGTDGNITLPAGGDIVDSDNNSVIRIEAPFVIKTVGFDAFAGGRYGVNTTSNVVTATLPPSPVAGEAIWFADAGGAYATNNLIINPGSGTIMGASGTMTVSTNDQSFGLFYNGTTWRVY